MMKLSSLTAVALFLVSSPAFASPTSGEIRKIDENANKLTIRHGPIENLGMDAMTMVFSIPDPAMLSGLSVGDRITFEADRIAGSITIMRIEKAF